MSLFIGCVYVLYVPMFCMYPCCVFMCTVCVHIYCVCIYCVYYVCECALWVYLYIVCWKCIVCAYVLHVWLWIMCMPVLHVYMCSVHVHMYCLCACIGCTFTYADTISTELFLRDEENFAWKMQYPYVKKMLEKFSWTERYLAGVYGLEITQITELKC